MENKKIIDYIVVESARNESLCTEVLKKLNEGYVLLDGVSLSVDYNWNHNFAQAMVKYEE